MKTLDGKPFENPGHYRSFGGEGEIDPNCPLMLQQPRLPPSGLYWVRNFWRRFNGGKGQVISRWHVAYVQNLRGTHGDAPCPGQDYHSGSVAMIGMSYRDSEDFDLSEAEWRTLREPSDEPAVQDG